MKKDFKIGDGAAFVDRQHLGERVDDPLIDRLHWVVDSESDQALLQGQRLLGKCKNREGGSPASAEPPAPAVHKPVAALGAPEGGDAAAFLRDCLQPLWQVQPSTALYERALKLQTTVSLSFYDSLIVAAALEAGCQRLLTEDLQHGQRIEGLWVEDPFRG